MGWLDTQKASGLLSWLRCQQPVEHIRDRQGRVRIISRGKGPADYHIQAAGLSLVLEAKSCSEPRWYLGNLHPHQARAMNDHTGQGGHAAIALFHHPPGLPVQRVIIPWAKLKPIWDRWNTCHVKQGEASLTTEQIRGLGLVMDMEGVWLEWFRRG